MYMRNTKVISPLGSLYLLGLRRYTRRWFKTIHIFNFVHMYFSNAASVGNRIQTFRDIVVSSSYKSGNVQKDFGRYDF